MFRRFVQAVALCSIIINGAMAQGQEVVRPDLTGRVVDASGKAVANATVFIYTAGVKKGYSTYCPGCYPDCAKQTTTDSAGAFTIESLDPELYFNLLTVADGYRPVQTPKVDPFGEPVEIEIERQPPAPEDLTQLVRGRVVNAAGEPVVGAVVSPAMIHFTNGGGRGGKVEGLDPLAVTNEQGRFEIRYTEPIASMDLEAEARGLAPQFFPKRATGADEHTLMLDIGASVTGRLMQDGRPLGGVQMGLVQADRSPVNGWFGAQYIGTDDQGYFRFENMPIGYDWYLYGTMNSLRDYGAVEVRSVRTSTNGEIVKVGDLSVGEAHYLKGQVVLTDGKEIEPGMRMFIARGRAWDSQTIDLPPDGRFEFFGLPTERYDIFISIRGYRLSADNPNLNSAIMGVLDESFDDFVILAEPGPRNDGVIQAKLQDRPLQSAKRP